MKDKFDSLYGNLSLIVNKYKIFKILYAEDDEILREQVLSILNEIFGKDSVISAIDGKEALKKYQKNKPNIVILDIQMPKLNGLEVIYNIKEIESSNELAIALFTAFNDLKYLSKALELNIDGYILKPLNQEQFLELLLKMTKNVLNIFLTNKYQSLLEGTNLEISKKNKLLAKLNMEIKLKNRELENKNIELEKKIIELEKEKRYSNSKNTIIINEQLTKTNMESEFNPSWFTPSARKVKEAMKISSLFLLDDKYEEIKEIIDEIDSIIPTVCKDKSFAINTYANLLQKISFILSTIDNEVIINIVKVIGELIKNMLNNKNILENKKDKSIITYLESIPKDLIEWFNIIEKYGIYSKQEIIQSDILVMALRQVSTFTQGAEEFNLDDFFF